MLTLPGPLVSVDWLADHLTEPLLRIADVRWSLAGPPGRERYEDGHIPGAVFLDADTELSSPGEGPGRHPIPTSEKLARVLGGAGIGDQHLVVAYDDAGGSVASRLWWLYRHFGRDGACAVLDGGLTAWTDAGQEIETDAAEYPRAAWTPGPAKDDVVGTDEVLSMRGDWLLLDARAAERYRGEVEPIDPRAGHVPGAVSAPYTANLGEDGRFLAPQALRQRYARLGTDNDRPVVAYCGSSLSATHDLLALEIAGVGGGRLYEGSWSHWSSDPDRPVATGSAP